MLFEKNPLHSLKRLLENSNSMFNNTNNIYSEFLVYYEKNFKLYVEKMNYSLGNYKTNQSI